jgi:hypothetical protein
VKRTVAPPSALFAALSRLPWASMEDGGQRSAGIPDERRDRLTLAGIVRDVGGEDADAPPGRHDLSEEQHARGPSDGHTTGAGEPSSE